MTASSTRPKPSSASSRARISARCWCASGPTTRCRKRRRGGDMSGFYALPTAVQIAIFTTIVSVATTIGTVLWNYATQQEMERFKARIAQAASLDNAKLEYEFDARKRLYARIAPLLFQLAEAAEGSYYRIVNLVGMRSAQKVERLAKKALLDGDGSLVRTNYYLTSTLYKIFLPFALYRLLQRSATSFDLTLDSE